MTKSAALARAVVAVAIATTVAACVLAVGQSGPTGVDAWSGGLAGFRLWTFVALVPVVVLTVVVHLHRPDHALGRLLAVASALLGLSTCAGIWLRTTDVQTLRDGVAIAGAVFDIAAIVAVGALLALFPSGRGPRPFERLLLWAAGGFCVAVALLLLGAPLRSVATATPPWSPLQVPSLLFFGGRGQGFLAFAALLPLVGIGLLTWRSPAMDGEERIHLRWLALAGVTAASVLALVHLVRRLGLLQLGGDFYGVAPRVIAWLLVAAAVTVTALRPDVADAAAAVRRVAVAAALVVTLGLAGGLAWYATGVSTGTWLPGAPALAAGLTVAALFFPAREAFERAADRWLFGDAIGDAQLLSAFGQAAERTAGLDGLAELIATTARRGLHVMWATVSLHDPERTENAPTAEAGLVPDAPVPAASVELAIGGDVVGRLDCGPKRRGSLTDHDRQLLAALAREAALDLQNARQASALAEQLVQIRRQAEELTASRTRIVQAQEAERRRIERNIHDGAQQELAALLAKLRLAQNQLGRDPDTAERTIEEAQHDVRRALDDVRSLARGIHPAVLSDRGLLEAIESSLTRLPLEAIIEADPALRARRFPDEIEGAAYFMCSEALANVLKYASATRVEVVLAVHDERLWLRVTDNGIGFDPQRVDGTGLPNLADRVEALGGRLRVQSTSGAGTTVALELPVVLRQPASIVEPATVGHPGMDGQPAMSDWPA
ncbi:MAG TPA: sensor histidine kinase [Nocardioidaceae bacterium]